MKRRDLNVCQEGARQAAWLSPLCPQRNGSYWEASVLPCQSKQWAYAWTVLSSSTIRKKKKGSDCKKRILFISNFAEFLNWNHWTKINWVSLLVRSMKIPWLQKERWLQRVTEVFPAGSVLLVAAGYTNMIANGTYAANASSKGTVRNVRCLL